ncbi:tetratricopeptide repeat-containing sensor histidine kinase [Maribacter polysaccharolyticus]|uniref:tetratricopeptide repeat-containing sensor histidine kinase n=1 Tax=Maribacter polysaccharolyticus TaxID=3020831 RepID=UPI00237F1F88|nr:ATP-binding protein [Maribacter polysaccharolyticus]MDE3740627.1 ATP-binding protein [Maribacter polysaccharolyticus]
MLRTNRPTIFHLTKGLLLPLWCILFSSCSQPDNPPATPENVANDSILSWISQSRNPVTSITEKKQLLQKAFLAADKSPVDSTRLRYYSRLSLAFLELNDSTEFRTVNKKTLSLAKKTNDTINEAYAHWDLADFFETNIAMDSAFYHYHQAQKKFEAVGDTYYSGRLFYNMALIQTDVKDYTGAEINAFNSIERLKPLDEYLRLHRCYNLLGSISNELKEYERSLEYFNLANEYLSKVKDQEVRNNFLPKLQNNIGNTYKNQGNYEDAKRYYQKAVFNNDSLRFKAPSSYALFLNNFALSRLKLGDTLGVLKDLETAREIRKNQKDIEGLSLSEYTFAEYYLTQNDTVNALERAKMAKQYAEEGSNNKRLLASLGLLARIDPKNSLNHTQHYIALTDSLLQIERKERDKFTRIRFETDEFIAENESLARKKQIWTGLSIGIFLLGVSVYVIFYQRSKNQALRFQQQQQTSNQEIFDLMLSQKQKIAETKKAEQKRISEELHDGVLGKMLGARMVLTGLNKINSEEAISERAKAISALKDVEGEVRAISHELSHAAYHNINNFINSIKDLLKNICSANDLNYTFDYEESQDWDNMKGEIKINLYRMVQEIMQNAVKHANCKNILVSFVRRNEMLLVAITDDGKGFASKPGKKGIGMRNIGSRIEKLGGTWNIDSTLNKGTTITLNIPLETQEAVHEMNHENLN